jgi:hypothetical protein
MTDDRGPEPPPTPSPAPPYEAVPPPASAPEAAGPPAAPDPAPAAASAAVPAATTAASVPAVERSRWPGANIGETQRERLLLVTTGVLFVIAVLLGLMVFAPSIAPIKLGITRQAASVRSEAEVQTVARRFATNFYSIDYRTLESDFEKIRSDTTGDLLRQLSQVTSVIREPYRKTRSIVSGRPKQVTVVSLTNDVASVQVILSITIRNSKNPEPETRDQPLQLTLVRTGSGWKVSQVYQQPVMDQG